MQAQELSAQLTVEATAAARSRYELQALRSEQSELRTMLREDKQSSSGGLMEVSAVELPLLQAQLHACQLEEKAASERCTVTEGWLQGAASEAREAMAMARKMATAEVACLAEVAAASEGRA